MSTVCQTCDFRARTAQGLAGHLRLAHAVSPARRKTGVQRSPVSEIDEHSLGRAVRQMVETLPDVLPEPEVLRRVGQRLWDMIAQKVADEIWKERGDDLLEMAGAGISEHLLDPGGCRQLLVMLLGRPEPESEPFVRT